jgi:hypothetical protein
MIAGFGGAQPGREKIIIAKTGATPERKPKKAFDRPVFQVFIIF